MRTAWQAPRDKQYFHTKRKMDKRDIAMLKNKMQKMYQRKNKRKDEEQFLRRRRR